MSPAEIADAVAAPRNNVRQIVFKMAKAGEVLKVGRGRYIHPERRDLDNSQNGSNSNNSDNGRADGQGGRRG